jgi:desulfoferrodoxin (superoxide reductase-like protein)
MICETSARHETGALIVVLASAGATREELVCTNYAGQQMKVALIVLLYAPNAFAATAAEMAAVATYDALNIPYTSTYYPAVGHSSAKHVPLLTVSGNTATLSVGATIHPISPTHYIGAAWVRDQNGAVVFYQAFPTDGSEQPIATFTVPPGATALIPYEWCNLHGTWQGNAAQAPATHPPNACRRANARAHANACRRAAARSLPPRRRARRRPALHPPPPSSRSRASSVHDLVCTRRRSGLLPHV